MSFSRDPDPGEAVQPSGRFSVLAGMGVLLAAAVGLLAAGLWPAESLKAHLDALAPGGVPIGRVVGLQTRALGAAAISILLSGLLWLARRPVTAGQQAAACTLREAWSWAMGQVRPIRIELALLTLIALGLRILFLGQPMRVDESTTYLEFVSKNWLVAVSNYGAPNNHILHTIFAKLATVVFGGEPWAIRLTALLAGTIMAPAAALAACAIHGARAAVPAAALVTVCWPWIFYSANARGYTLAGLLFLLLVPLAARLRTGPSVGAWIWFAIVAAFGLFTVPVMVYPLVPLCVWILAARPRAAGELAAASVAAAALTLLLYAPVLAATGFGPGITPEMTPLPRATAGSHILEFGAALWRQCHTDLPVWFPLLLGACALSAWRAGSLARLSLAWFFLALWVYPVMPYLRLWLWLSLPWLLWAASGLGRLLPARWIAPAALVLVLWQSSRILASGSIPASVETGVFRDAAAAARFLKDHWQPGDQVRTDADPAPLRYEMLRLGLQYRPCAGGRCWAIIRPPKPESVPPLVRLGRRAIYLSPGAVKPPQTQAEESR
jgi:hypothetical protein